MENKMKNKKIKIELTLDEVQTIIDCINAWDYEDSLSWKELDLLDKLLKIVKENEN